MKRRTNSVPVALLVLALSAGALPSVTSAAPAVSGYTLVSSQRVTRTEFDYTYQVSIKNDGLAVKNVAAHVYSQSASTVIMDGDVSVGAIDAATTVSPPDTITVRQDRSAAFSPINFFWQVTFEQANNPPIANAGPDVRTASGEPVALDGRASSDVDGNPLRYEWSLVSAPTGANPVLSDRNNPIARFLADAAGLYRLRLTVNDGVADSIPDEVQIEVDPADRIPPYVMSRYPHHDATQIPANASITMQFSEPMDAYALVEAMVVLNPIGSHIDGTYTYTDTSLTFTPAAPLIAGYSYHVVVTGTVTDRAGNRLGADVTWDFTTGDQFDRTPPNVVRVTPDNGATGIVQARLRAIEIEFSESIDPVSVANAIVVSTSSGQTIPGAVRSSGNRAVFEPQFSAGQNLSGQTLSVQLLTSIHDLAGNPLPQYYVWSFKMLPSHSPAYLSKAGAISAQDTAAYYANLPLYNNCRWWWDWVTDQDRWLCRDQISDRDVFSDANPPRSGAQAAFDGFMGFWDEIGWKGRLGGTAAFYDADSLAAGRRAHCFVSDRESALPGPGAVACYAKNHGPVPGTPEHPDRQWALTDAIADSNPVDQNAFSTGVMFFRGGPAEETIEFDLNESAPDYVLWGQNGGPNIFPGDVVSIEATGRIWAGNLFFGENDPNGIAGYECTTTIFDPAPCPLEHAPLYGLLIDEDFRNLPEGGRVTSPRFLGTQPYTFKATKIRWLRFLINDHVHGNGNGAFHIRVTIRRANMVSFALYGADGALRTTADFDGEGPKPVPQVCMSCHGGLWDPESKTVNGARFLPFDIARLQFSNDPNHTRAAQEEEIRKMNEIVSRTQPATSNLISQWLNGTYANNITRAGQVAIDNFTPPSWAGDEQLYQGVVRPYCQSCHQALNPAIDFSTSAQFRSYAPSIQQAVCNTRSMPHAEPTFIGFWQSLAPRILSDSLFGGATCGP
jgi:hypothetical protein